MANARRTTHVRARVDARVLIAIDSYMRDDATPTDNAHPFVSAKACSSVTLPVPSILNMPPQSTSASAPRAVVP